MVIRAGAIRASSIDEPFNIESASTGPTSIIDIDISEGSNVGGISLRSGCKQGTCPDNKSTFDYMKRFLQDYSSEHNLACTRTTSASTTAGNACRIKPAVMDGCANLTSCRRKQNICVDTSKGHAHRIDRNVKNATVFTMIRSEAVGWRKGRTFIGLIRRLSATGKFMCTIDVTRMGLLSS